MDSQLPMLVSAAAQIFGSGSQILAWLALILVATRIPRGYRSAAWFIGAGIAGALTTLLTGVGYPLVGLALASTAAFEVYQYVYAGVGTVSTLLWLASWALLLFAIFTLAGELRAVVDAADGGDRPHG